MQSTIPSYSKTILAGIGLIASATIIYLWAPFIWHLITLIHPF